MNAALIPPIAPEDRLPHEKAVWREERPIMLVPGLLVSVDYGVGQIVQTRIQHVDWPRVVRWRFGWAG